MFDAFAGSEARRLGEKLFDLNWAFILVLTMIAGIGFAMLISAANGSLDPWASRQMVRFGIGLSILILVALVDIRVWMQLAYPAYGLALLLLVAVFFVGVIGKGAQRWLDLGPLSLQPSELMKISLVLALARYYHGFTLDEVSRPHGLLVPLLMIGAPVALVYEQPDLGTALLLAAVGSAIVFLAGIRWRYILGLVALAVPALWGAWTYLLHDYQRQRVLTFLDPQSDPLGAGYHITQAKIALGSGGVWGKGYMQGTQSHLNFLPEQQTDFIFTMLAEEFGMVGSLALLGLYGVLLVYGGLIALSSRNHFGRLVAMGVTINFFLYILINVSMVMGLIPVVGVPLPLVSYGGTAMMTLMFGFGLLLSVHVHRRSELPRKSAALW